MQHPTIEFQFLNRQSPQKEISCYAFGVFENNAIPHTENLIHEPFYDAIIVPLIKESQFTGKKCEVASANYLHQAAKVMLVGLGKKEEINQESIRQAANVVYKECLKLHSRSVAVNFATFLDTKTHLQAFAEGILLPAHLDERFKSKKDTKTTRLEKVYLIGTTEDLETIQLTKNIITGVNRAKQLVNAPANYVTPSTLAETAVELAKKYDLDIKILEEKDCAQLNMGAYLSVTHGSDALPKFIHLCYKPKALDSQSAFPKIALIGKGVTFDSGGLNLKIGNSSIELMKCDMSGAAALLGAAEAIGAIKPNKEIHFIIAATENMINGHATKPGDIVTASNGKTIEVDNTDAEGRLTLADALVYAEKLGVNAIVDLATLTGAIVGALGVQIAGIFGTDQQLIDSLVAASPRTGEKIWQMPLEEAYFESMHSVIADMRNTGKRGAGSITAALFLKQFVAHTPWAHIDIAGTAWAEQPWSYNNVGATGFGVRLLVDWILAS